MDIWGTIKYFKPYEFDSPDKPNSHIHMDSWFIFLLDFLREKMDEPIVLTSAYRTPEHNQKIGGVNDSAHLKGLAVDIRVLNGQYRYKLTKNAIMLGIRRIGQDKNFLHIDIDDSKPDSMWIY